MVRSAKIRDAIKRGWRWNETTGMLEKGEGHRLGEQKKIPDGQKYIVETRPSTLMPSKSGDLDFNPARDAFALRMKAVFVGPNRYLLAGLGLVDANGALRDPDACPECGSRHGEYRYSVRVANADPRDKRPEKTTFCSRCCNDADFAYLRGLAPR